jgi:tetratricopeptide (TPR) repeat protein
VGHKAKRFLAAAAAVLAASAVANADVLSDCTTAKDGAVRIRQCGALIESPGTSPELKLAALRARAGAYAARADHDKAIADYTQAIALKANDGEAYAGRGEARLAKRDTDGAIADFTQAIRYSGDTPALYVTRGYAQLVKGANAEAAADFTVAIGLDNKNASAYNNRGLAYRKKGDLDLAIEDYTTAIKLNPSYALAFNNRGYVFEAKGQKQEASADFRRALSLDPSLVGAKKALARLGEPEIVTLESDRLVAQGKALAQKNCAWCHAIGKTGASANPRAPAWRDIHKRHPILALRDPLSRGIARPHDEMPQFQLSDDEVDTIIAYINSLGP